MSTQTITLQIPDLLYQRLVHTAMATQLPLEQVILKALRVGSPPGWDNVPDEFQADLAALDKLDDDNLWKIAKSEQTEGQMARYQLLLTKNQEDSLTEPEKLELLELRHQGDSFMLKKAQASVLLRWRGHHVPQP